MYKPSDKKEIDRHDINSYWRTSIKYIIQWFPFLIIIDHTKNLLKPNKGIIPSLLKVFSMFQLRLFYDKKYKEEKYLEAMAINCINCNKNAGLCIKNRTIEGIITKFVLNSILHHVGMPWIICSNNEMFYEIE